MSGKKAAPAPPPADAAEEEVAKPNPFTVLPVEEPVRPVSAGSDASSQSSTSSNEVVVVEQEKQGEEDKQEPEEKRKEPEQENDTKTEIPSPETTKDVTKDDLVSIIPTPEATTEPLKPTAAKLTKAAGHGTNKFTSCIPGCLVKSSALISRLNQVMSTVSGTDRVLMTISYSLTALTAQLDRISQRHLLAQSVNPPKFSVVPIGFFKTLLITQPKTTRLLSISTRLKALGALISDVRIFMRLWGLFGIHEWLVSTLRDPPQDLTLRRIAYLQIVVNIFYQILENLAYLGQHKVLPIGKKRQNSYWLWSSRFWMAHVVLEFWRLKRDRDLSSKSKEKTEFIGADEQPKWYDVAGVMKSEGKQGVWLRQLWSNMAYAPLTVHWSLESGALSQLSVGTLGTIAGIIGLHQAWRRTA